MANVAKQKQIALAVSAVLGGLSFVPTAQAVNLSTDGLGEALNWSYYSVNGGNSTLFNIINTSDHTVAGRLRFRESRNSRDVYDIVVVLSPHDYWNGIVEADPTYGASIRTTDLDTCTVPALNTPLNRGFKTRDLTDGGPTDVSRLKEGYFEFIEMGSVPGELKESCAQVTTLFTDNSTSTGGAAALDKVKKTFSSYVANPLKGVANIINVAGWNTAYEPTVFADFYVPPKVGDNLVTLHLPPNFQNIPINNDIDRYRASWYEPTLASANTPAQVLVADGELFTSPAPGGANAISYLLSRTDVINTWSERLMSEGAAWDTSTALVLTLPTKGFYVDRSDSDMAASGYKGLVGRPLRGPEPFTSPWSWSATTGPESCDPIRISLYDREENLYDDPPVTSPWGQGYEICNEANVITFRGGNPLFSNNPYNVDFTVADFPADAGWIDINLHSPANLWVPEKQVVDAPIQLGYRGLPVVGFGYTYRDQGTATGVRDSVSYEHAYKRNLIKEIKEEQPE